MQPAACPDASGSQCISESRNPGLPLILTDRLSVASIEVAFRVEPLNRSYGRILRFFYNVAGIRNVINSAAAALRALAIGIIGNHQRSVALHHYVGRLESIWIV